MQQEHNTQQQTFTGRTVREAYARVREALGRDAVIVEQRNDGGIVTVVACREFPERAERSPGGRDDLAGRLITQGFEPAFAARMAGVAHNVRELELVVLNGIAVEAPPVRLEGAYRFLGAPGAGKTTAIIKLAAEHVLRFGAAGCALVTTDQRRLAGSEQLQLAAELLGIRFVEVTPSALDGALEQLQDSRLVLVDTAGVNAGQPALESAACPDVLVLPAPWQARALRRSLAMLPRGRLAGVVLTQVDQCEGLGQALSVLAELGVPLRWLSRGGDLYEDLEPASRKLLAELAFPSIDRSQMSTTFA